MTDNETIADIVREMRDSCDYHTAFMEDTALRGESDDRISVVDLRHEEKMELLKEHTEEI